MVRSAGYSDIEMMLVVASRAVKDGQLVFVGTFWPLLAVTHAKKHHANNIISIFEGGVIRDAQTFRLPLLTTDISVMVDPILMGDCFDTLGMILHGGRDQMSMLSAANIDKYGNINTTCVGNYDNPDYRLAGSGGAADFGAFSKNLVILIEQEARRFQKRVDYITTPGYLQGWESREEAGLEPGTGPSAVISTMGIFEFNKKTKEMYLAAHFPWKSVDDIRNNVQWDLKVSDDIYEVEPPGEEELRVLREEVDPNRTFLID